jgi:hypothetical protein
MKRLDKPTKTQVNNLMNIKKISAIPLNILSNAELPKSLTSKSSFLCLPVSRLKSQFHVHPKPAQNSTVEGEDT